METVMADYAQAATTVSIYYLLGQWLSFSAQLASNLRLSVPHSSGLICSKKSKSSMTLVKISTSNGSVKYEAGKSLAWLKCTRCRNGDCYTRAVFCSKRIPRWGLQRLALFAFFWLLGLTRLPWSSFYRLMRAQILALSVACGKMKYLLQLKLKFSPNNHRFNNGANKIAPLSSK